MGSNCFSKHGRDTKTSNLTENGRNKHRKLDRIGAEWRSSSLVIPNKRVLGERIINLARVAVRDVTLIAPFVKRASLARVLENVNAEGRTLTCVTRWRPE